MPNDGTLDSSKALVEGLRAESHPALKFPSWWRLAISQTSDEVVSRTTETLAQLGYVSFFSSRNLVPRQ